MRLFILPPQLFRERRFYDEHKLPQVRTTTIRSGKNIYSLRKDKVVGTETIKKLQQGYGIIDTRTISNLCEYLNCQPGDLMEYVTDKQDQFPGD